MFTWICPQCGREVPPSYSECPNCAEARKRGTHPQAAPAPSAYPPPSPPAPPVYQAPAPPPVVYPQPQTAPPPPYSPPQPQYTAPPPQQFAPPPPAYAPPPAPPAIEHSQPYYVVGAEPKKKVPAWAVVLGTAIVLGGVLWGAYRFLGGTPTAQQTTESANPSAAAVPPGTHPYGKFLELTGLRMTEDGKKVKVQYLVVNHSAADFTGLELQVSLTTVNASAGAPPIATFKSKIGTVPAFGFTEVTESVTTKLRAYELPDWQFLKADFAITAPN